MERKDKDNERRTNAHKDVTHLRKGRRDTHDDADADEEARQRTKR